jgi:hypothetical protein
MGLPIQAALPNGRLWCQPAIVVTPLGTKLCRPSETVLELLDRKPASFTKEDGEIVRL